VVELIGVAALASCLVAVSTLAARVWGHGIGGLVSAFPLIVGPVLLLAALREDAAFAADTAAATLLGLVALSGFVLAYGRCAGRWGWPSSVALGWVAAAMIGVLAGRIGAGLHSVGLTLAGERFGPTVAGILAALPTLASVLAVFTHARHGNDALVALLHGMLGGLAGFVSFCALIGLLIEPAGVIPAFLLATAAAVLVQAVAVRLHAPLTSTDSPSPAPAG
jgi:hypothetical protein